MLVNKESPAFVYSKRMLEHYDTNYGKFEYRFQAPEYPQRIVAIYEHLLEHGFLEQMLRLDIEDQGLAGIEAVHSKELIAKVMATEEMNESETAYTIHPDNYQCKGTFEACKCAVDASLTLLRYVLEKESCGYAITRPPGHHAHPNLAYGFCFFNNVAICAKEAINTFGLKKVLIFDWDIHQGDGTQDIFYEDQ